MTNQDKRTASQRIDDLERAVMSIYNVANNMSRENTLIKNALKLLDSKVECMQDASIAGEALTNENLTARMKEKELVELKGKVQNLIDQGFLVSMDTVAENAFIVGSETEPDAADGTPGKVVHARLQFTLASLEKSIQEKLLGAKVGDTVAFKEGALVFKISEAYKIVEPTPAPAPEVAQPAPVMDSAPEVTPAPAVPEEAPAPQSSTDATTAEAPTSQAAGN